MKKKKYRNEFEESRAEWADENGERFMEALKRVSDKTGVMLTPMQYVKAYELCIKEYYFGYPSEFKIAELISTDETYDQTLAIMKELMKYFRIEFYRSRNAVVTKAKLKEVMQIREQMNMGRKPVKRMDISINMEATGANIKRLIKASGYSVRDIMAVTGISTEQAVYKWYRGESIPTIETLLILCNTLGIGIEELLVIDGGFDLLIANY